MHALVVVDRFVLTLSRILSPRFPPRPARFRSLYSNYASFGQFPLKSADFALDREVVVVNDRSQPIYVLIGHGPAESYGELGFVYANFMAPGGLSYLGSGIDLFARYATTATPDSEDIQEPDIDLRDDDAEEEAQGG